MRCVSKLPWQLWPQCRGIAFESAAALRHACRSNTWAAPTTGEAPGFVQANLVILPGKYAEQFRDFCVKNAAPCPLLEHTGPGSFEPRLAPGADIRTDLPKHGFLLGCSFTWEDLLAEAELTPRHVQERRNVPMFNTSITLRSAGPFKGHMVVSMRPYREEDVPKVATITGEYPAAHGPPVQIGHPSRIGIEDLAVPDYAELRHENTHLEAICDLRRDMCDNLDQDGEVPVFWACGVTPQNALKNARLPLVITHAPGHMFVCDVRNHELKDWPVPGEWLPAEETASSETVQIGTRLLKPCTRVRAATAMESPASEPLQFVGACQVQLPLAMQNAVKADHDKRTVVVRTASPLPQAAVVEQKVVLEDNSVALPARWTRCQTTCSALTAGTATCRILPFADTVVESGIRWLLPLRTAEIIPQFRSSGETPWWLSAGQCTSCPPTGSAGGSQSDTLTSTNNVTTTIEVTHSLATTTSLAAVVPSARWRSSNTATIQAIFVHPLPGGYRLCDCNIMYECGIQGSSVSHVVVSQPR
eukprot:g17847.t1